MKSYNNIRLDKENQVCFISVNPKIYPLETIYSASYVFLDKAYIQLDGNPGSEIIIRILPKNNKDLEKIGHEFMNELMNYADYITRQESTKRIREILMQRVLLTNDPSLINQDENNYILKTKEETIDDPDDIHIPWEDDN